MSFRTAYGNTYSENRWRMCNRDECDIVRIPELYLVDTAPLRTGAPLTILGAWLYWYDRNVEEITSPVWGWSATNDVANSNHLAGTAVDINAPKYPWGDRTMPAARIAKVRAGLKLFEGAVYWGADWNRADEMHYQMAWPEGDTRNDAFAAKLRAGFLGIYTPSQPPAPVQKSFPQDLSDRELLEYIAAQLGPGDPAWASKGMTLRDKVWSK
ncbi:M15 family metallopeptidase [Mycobacteroides sp. PCS013]|uniref:M15 family metallopeptidase n=1 Tax=Mycobacteroides sp. PCS013 TaxID=3074106 RepID=UPI003C2EDA40